MIEVVLRRPGRVVRMRVVEAKQLGAQLPRAPLRCKVILRADKEPPARTLFRCVRQPEGRKDLAISTEERTAALVRVSLTSVLTDGVGHSCLKLERH